MTGKEITYDTREPAEFIKFLKEQLPDFKFIGNTMLVGDFEVNGVIVERKTAADYIGSMKSGRLNNQLCSMSYNFELSYVFIIGNLTKTAMQEGVPRATVISSKIGDSFKRFPDGKQGQIVTVEFETDWDFALGLKHLALKEKIRMPQITKIHVSKSDRVVGTVASFPGWGEKLSRRALKKYGTFAKMCESNPEEMAKQVYGCGLTKANAFFDHLQEIYKNGK